MEVQHYVASSRQQGRWGGVHCFGACIVASPSSHSGDTVGEIVGCNVDHDSTVAKWHGLVRGKW